eukprot:186639-Prymnesium_polylepis.1
MVLLDPRCAPRQRRPARRAAAYSVVGLQRLLLNIVLGGAGACPPQPDAGTVGPHHLRGWGRYRVLLRHERRLRVATRRRDRGARRARRFGVLGRVRRYDGQARDVRVGEEHIVGRAFRREARHEALALRGHRHQRAQDDIARQILDVAVGVAYAEEPNARMVMPLHDGAECRSLMREVLLNVAADELVRLAFGQRHHGGLCGFAAADTAPSGTAMAHVVPLEHRTRRHPPYSLVAPARVCACEPLFLQRS